MLQGVYSQNRIRQNFAPQQNLGIITPTRAQYPQFKEISPEANSAICAYMSPVINRDTVPQIPLKAMINRLKMQGKVEGKDFVIDKAINGNLVLSINNKYGLPEKEIHYDNKDFDHWSFCDEFIYKGNKRIRSLTKNDRGQTLSYSNTYYNSEIPQERFMSAGMAQSNSPEDYINYLKDNNIKYSAKKDGNKYFIVEFDKQNKQTQYSNWSNGRIIDINKYDENESRTQVIDFQPHRTIVRNYTRTRIPVGHFSRKEFPQENFTDERITYETTPRDYVNYLKKNGVKYKATKVDNHDEKCIVVKEFDKDNKEKAWTIWSYELNSDMLIGIQHEVNKSNGNATRVVIEKDKTFVEKIE